MKWIVAGAAVVVVVLILLLRDVLSDDRRPGKIEPRPHPVATDPIDAVPQVVIRAPPIDAGPPGPDAAPGELTLHTDEFWQHVDEAYPRQLLGSVADCYKGGKNPHQKMRVTYKIVVKDHWLTLTDVKMLDSDLADPDLEGCFLRSLEHVRFKDDQMPNWIDPDDERLLIRIELLKRFLPHQDNGMP